MVCADGFCNCRAADRWRKHFEAAGGASGRQGAVVREGAVLGARPVLRGIDWGICRSDKSRSRYSKVATLCRLDARRPRMRRASLHSPYPDCTSFRNGEGRPLGAYGVRLARGSNTLSVPPVGKGADQSFIRANQSVLHPGSVKSFRPHGSTLMLPGARGLPDVRNRRFPD